LFKNAGDAEFFCMWHEQEQCFRPMFDGVAQIPRLKSLGMLAAECGFAIVCLSLNAG
jgi:hypothetical protein